MNKHIFRLLAVLSVLGMPMTVYGTESIDVLDDTAIAEVQEDATESERRIEVHDTVSGLGTTIEVHEVEPARETNLIIAPPLGPEIILSVSLDSQGNGTVHITGNETQLAGTYLVSLEQDGNLLSDEAVLEVLPETLDPRNASIQVDRTYLEPDRNDSVQVSVILRDRYGNPLGGRPVELISSRTSDLVSAAASETDESGEQYFSISTHEPGIIALRAIDLLSGNVLDAKAEIQAGNMMNGIGGYIPSYQNSYQPMYPTNNYAYRYPTGSRYAGSVMGRTLYGQVNEFDVLAGFEIRAPAQLNVNEDANITITAVDQFGKTVEDYTGMVLLTSTDPMAFLPLGGEIPFQPRDLGSKTLTLGLRFRTPSKPGEPHLLVARDNADPSIESIVEIDVSGDAEQPAERLIDITSPEQDSTVNSVEIVIEGSGPPFINLTIQGGEKDAIGETDSDGNFSIPVTLSADQLDHTLRVRDESGRYDSGNLHLVLDTELPEVTSIIFTPQNPEEGQDILLVIESEPELVDGLLTIGDTEIALEESATDPGKYQALFTAPKPGNYQALISVSDPAGNITEVRSNIVVTAKGLPQVQNVQAEPKANEIALEWDPIDVKVDAYRVYVGDAPDNFLYTLDTELAVTSATVAGLLPGATYYLAVTALEGERESVEKSEVVKVTVLGMQLTVTPQDSSLLLEWTSPDEFPLSSFLLEYGVEPDDYIEQRTLNGDLRKFPMRDLMNNVTYFLRLTPVTTTGDILRDIAVIGQGTPISDTEGFHPAPGEPSPLVPGVGITVPPKPPEIPRNGIPLLAWWIAAAIGTLLLSFHWHRRRTTRMTMDFMRAMEAQYKG